MAVYPAVGSSFGRYRVTGALGHGGMGVVLTAVHEELGRNVALKVLAPELALRAEFRDRFQREAKALARLYSPHIIDVYDYGTTDGFLWIATQLVTGGDLRDWLARNGPMAPDPALEVMAQVASAISDAHDAGIVHRDIKPSNVLLRASPEDVFAYVCDFGISQTNQDDRTRTNSAIGTYAYMAPERHEGAPASVASDIYSLGCLLYATLTGGAPYSGTDVHIAMQHLSADPPTCEGPEPVTTAVNAIVGRCLAKEPRHRYSSASALRSDLVDTRRLTVEDADAVTRLEALSPSVVTGDQTRAGDPPVLVGADASPRRRRRGSPLLWAGAAAVALLVVAGTLYLLGHDAPGSSGGGSAASPGDGVTCWDQAHARRPAGCSPPQGEKGLRWLYPSLDFGRCFDRGNPTDDASQGTWFCASPGQPDDGIGYTMWITDHAAKRQFNEAYGRPPDAFFVDRQTMGYRWVTPAANARGLYKMTVLYLNHPFSATIRARSAAGRHYVCAGLMARSLITFDPGRVNCPPA